VDTAERKRIEAREQQLIAEAVEATAKFRAVFDQSAIFAGVLTVEGILIDANRICLEACGYRAEEVLRRPFWETGWWRFNKDAQEKIRAATLEAAQGKPFQEELTYHWADGTARVVDFALHPIRNEQGMVIFLHPTGVDITERKQSEEDLRNARAELEKRVQERTAELNSANKSLRDLSARLLSARDQESRRIARELHDSIGQLLAIISMNVATVKAQDQKLDDAGKKAIAQSSVLISQISSEIRTISYLLHPPLLDELGLRSALQWLVDGFSQRSNVKVEMKIARDFGRLPIDLETAVFRIVQECLANIHRHSGSKTAAIQILQENDQIVIVARDAGKGIPADQLGTISDGQSGVGFRGMRERLRHLDGNLEIRSDDTGTVVTATLPFSASVDANQGA
jgi:PAS domain S-box-containing protein